METPRPERLHPIADASRSLGVHARTLMAYERIGLVKPVRRSNRRHYSDGEIRWLGCVQTFNRDGGISLQGLATLLRFVPCWAIRSEVERNTGNGESGTCCPASHPAEECLERVDHAYSGEAVRECRTCGVYREHRDRGRDALAAAGRLPSSNERD